MKKITFLGTCSKQDNLMEELRDVVIEFLNKQLDGVYWSNNDFSINESNLCFSGVCSSKSNIRVIGLLMLVMSSYKGSAWFIFSDRNCLYVNDSKGLREEVAKLIGHIQSHMSIEIEY